MDGNRQSSQDMGHVHSANAGATNGISIEQLQHLVRLLDQSDVVEIELKCPAEDMHLLLRKAKVKTPENGESQGMQFNLPSARAHSSAEGQSLERTSSMLATTRHQVIAPLVGIFHAGARPRGGSLVAVGDHVKAGQLVAIIESLNVFNEVESSVAGRVVEILVQEGQPIEYGQSLMSIESAENGEGA